MKSALELALEKTASSTGERLTEEQKKQIEEIRSIAKAKAAEEEIMAREKLASIADPQQAALLREQSAARIQKIRDDAEAKVDKVRKGRS